jgi:hypothetical protein
MSRELTDRQPAGEDLAELSSDAITERGSFGGLLPDVGMADRGQADLFSAIGRTKAPFQGIGDWPYLNAVVQERSEATLAELGEGEWKAAGGTYGEDGRPTFTATSPVATQAVRELADSAGGFLWTDELGTGWAVALLAGSDRDSASRTSLAVSWCGDGRLLDPRTREEYQRAIESRGSSSGNDERTSRWQIRYVTNRMWLYERAEQLLWLLHAAVLAQRRSVVLLPDVALGDVIWGGDRQSWPANWRATVGNILWSLSQLRIGKLSLDGPTWQPRFESRSVAVAYVEHLERAHKQRGFCRPHCPLWNHQRRHGHFLVQIGFGFLGELRQFAIGDGANGLTEFDFRRVPKGEAGKAVRSARKRGVYVPVHLPTKVFGASSWSGLSVGQRGIIQGLVGEVTRSQGGKKSNRPDQGEVLVGNLVPAVQKEGSIACPFLQSGARYVAFNGNGFRHGKGYSIVGKKKGGWLAKCGFLSRRAGKDASSVATAKLVRSFLADLRSVAGMLGLTVAASDPRTGRWFDLSELVRIAGLSDGASRLAGLHLRVYGPEDYLERCRGLLADRGKFNAIPGGRYIGEAASAVTLDGPTLDLRLRMSQVGVTQRQLARHLGVSEPFVCTILKGKKRWPGELLRRAEVFISERAGVGMPKGQAGERVELDVAV